MGETIRHVFDCIDADHYNNAYQIYTLPFLESMSFMLSDEIINNKEKLDELVESESFTLIFESQSRILSKSRH